MTIDTTIPGLTIKFEKVGSRTYPKADHIESGLNLFFWNRAPMACGKKTFVERFDTAISALGIDWTQTQDELFEIIRDDTAMRKFQNAIFSIDIGK